VEGEEGAEIELRGLEKLNLANVDILEWVDATGGLLNLLANNLWDELLGELSQAAAGSLTLNDLNHFLADGTDLGRLSVGGLLDLVLSSLGEGNGEEAEEVVVGCLDCDVGLNESLPLADQRSELVRGEIETVEVGQAVLALNLVDSELNLAERVVLILLQVGQRDLDDASLQGVVCVLETGGAVDEGLSSISDGESRWGLDAVPILSGEWILHLLLKTLLALREPLVLSDSHNYNLVRGACVRFVRFLFCKP